MLVSGWRHPASRWPAAISTDTGRILLHQPHGQVGYGQVTDLELAAKEILRMRDLLEEMLAEHTGQTLERIHADTDRDFVMEADEALEYGIIDRVISSRESVDRTGPIR